MDAFTYRGDVFLYTISNISAPVVLLAVWLSVISSGGNAPLSRNEFVQYYLVLTLINLWTSAWASPFIASDIRLGRISPYLTKPASFLAFQVGNNLGEKFLKSIYLVPILIALYYILDISLPSFTLVSATAFIASWVMAGVITFLINICHGLVAFWLDEAIAIEEIYDLFLFLLSGRIVPLFALPLIIQKLSFFLPFRYTLSLPIEIALHKLSTPQILQGLGIQLLWVICAIIGYKVLWSKGLKRYTATGS